MFDLQKDSATPLFDLTKGAADPTPTMFQIEADWDPATEGQNIDLDLCGIALGADGKYLNLDAKAGFVFFNNHQRGAGTFWEISEDDTTGSTSDEKGLPYDERITVDLTKVPPEVQKLRFCLFDYNGGSLNRLARAGVVVAPEVNGATDRDNAGKYDVTQSQKAGTVLCDLERAGDTWNVVAHGSDIGGLNDITAEYGIG